MKTLGRGPDVLIVDDNRDFARSVELTISEFAGRTRVVTSAEDAIAAVRAASPDVVLSDVCMPRMDGLELLDALRSAAPEACVVLFTGFGTVPAAVDAMKRGAADYLTKPVSDEELLVVLARVWGQIAERRELARLREIVHEDRCLHGWWARDPKSVAVIDFIERAAPSASTVLISGPSGTGKELVARALHAESTRAAAPFVAFNAGALPETLADAELFGCRRGAYTGAERDRRGLVTEANRGTLFIDELASMPLSLQSKLLRVLQEREVLPLGATVPISVDVRVVAATNVDPLELLASGQLRQDLYYRLAVLRVALPPLSERRSDIPLLARVFLERCASVSGAARKALSDDALALLMQHAWPGNVRELANVIERACVLTPSDVLSARDLRFEDESASSIGDATLPHYEEAKQAVLERFQRRYIERVVEEARGNLAQAARAAGLTRAALHRIVKKHDLLVRRRPQ